VECQFLDLGQQLRLHLTQTDALLLHFCLGRNIRQVVVFSGKIRAPYVQSVGFQKNGEALFGVVTVLGDFSVFDWTGYPEGPRPTGPFRVLSGPEYKAELAAKRAANAAMHKADPALEGLQLHEIHPVKFGGSPTDPANKVALRPDVHIGFTKWWAEFLRDIMK
jgi:hypothetical protein